MDIRQYRIDITRTLPDLGEKLNLCHMALGMASELEELQDAIRKKDEVGMEEELADWSWYAFNYANLRKFDLVIQHDLGYFNFNHLMIVTSKFCTVVKQIIAYGKAKHPQDEYFFLQTGVNAVFNFYENGIYPNMERALDRNIAKLKARYPEKFDPEKALNRDLDKERKTLEGGIN